jgi:OHCU decarboxylase
MTPFNNQIPSRLCRDQFINVFGGIYEHSSWIVELAWDSGLDTRHNSIEGLHAALKEIVDGAGYEPQLSLLRAHPDLAGKLAISGKLTEESMGEQAQARLDKCSPEEFEVFQKNNARYKEKFGFPYILAVKDRSQSQILKNFSQRIDLNVDEEFQEALSQVHQISLLRLSFI